MRLIGSRVEHQLREQLVQSNKALCNGGNEKLMHILQALTVDFTRTYVIDWTPEQAEDLYSVLLPNDNVLIVEIPRHEQRGSVIESCSLIQYERKCSKLEKLKVAIVRSLREEQ
jgi:hypothetical protein